MSEFVVRYLFPRSYTSQVMTEPRKRVADAVTDLVKVAGGMKPEFGCILQIEEVGEGCPKGRWVLVVGTNASGDRWVLKTFAGVTKAALNRLRGTCVEPLGTK